MPEQLDAGCSQATNWGTSVARLNLPDYGKPRPGQLHQSSSQRQG
jgi:hypothetical protein